MPMPEGYGTLGPIRILQKLKDAFKEKHKGKVEDRIVEMVQTDVETTVPDWNKEDST